MKTEMQKEMVQARLRQVLEPSWTDLWAILVELEAILGAILGLLEGAKSLFFHAFFNTF